MKAAPIIALLPGVFSAVVPITRRQEHGHGGSEGGGFDLGALMGKMPKISPGAMAGFGGLATKFMKVQKAFKVEQIPPVLNKEAKRIRLIYGPYRLRASNSKVREGNSFSLDPSGTGYLSTVGEDFPKDITILDAFGDVLDDNFKPIDRRNGLYNHHNVFIDLSQPAPAIAGCGDGNAWASVPANVFIGGAADTTKNRYTTNDGTFKSGLYIGKDDGIMQMMDIVNYSNETKVVYTIAEMEYLPGKQAGFRHAATSGIDLGMCSGKTGMFVYAPKGQAKFTFSGKDITVERNGYFLNLRGHMHDGGKDVSVKLNGEEVCLSKALYGGEGHEGVDAQGKTWTSIREMSTCDQPIRVKKGDKLSVSAHFDMTEHPARENSMGGMAEAMALLSATFAMDSDQ